VCSSDLYQFGSGPVRGFAVTLALGIVASVFTGVMMTHVIVLDWLRRARPQNRGWHASPT